MKFTKMSLVAALLIGSSAFAIENTKVSGDAKLYYSTTQDSADLFSKEASAAQAAVSLSLSSDLTEGISAGSKVTVLSTLGLEGQLVANTWEQVNGVSDAYIVNDLWLAATVANTTAKIGRMELDTPLVFSEKWSIVANTFEAAVLINTDIPNTTLVGAYVGGSNSQFNTGNAGFTGILDSENRTTGTDTVNNGTSFSQFFNGAYAAGVINNSFEPLTVQAWYYHATAVTTAYWVQADLNIDGILLGAQYTGISHGDADAGDAYAVMIGYDMKDTFTAKLSYSATSEEASAGFNLAGSGQSKLYTEAWWNYGVITAADTTAFNLTVEAPVKDIVDLGFYATMASNSVADSNDLTEITMTASKSFGPLDATAAAIYVDTNSNKSGILQAYLTYNF